MRLLVSCPECKRQYDASDLSAGSRFHCLCGVVLRVRSPEPHDASVVRCSSCGAPRQGQSASCHFCSGDFTLHERDLHTICPECMARVSDRAQFCHHCACPLIPSGTAGEPSQQICPVCQNDQTLTSRRVGEPAIGVLECPRCAGLWLATTELQILLKRTRATSPNSDFPLAVKPHGDGAADRIEQTGPLYRGCPICSNLMHRRNFGRKSGIIIDQCSAHGYWFDPRELETVLQWIREGGEHRVAKLEEEEKREASRRQSLDRQLEPIQVDRPSSSRGPGALLDLLNWLVGQVLVR